MHHAFYTIKAAGISDILPSICAFSTLGDCRFIYSEQAMFL